MLHELVAPNFVFHEPVAQSGVQNADGIGRFDPIRRSGAAARLQRAAVQRQAGGDEEIDEEFRMGSVGFVHAARRAGISQGAVGQTGEQDERDVRGGDGSEAVRGEDDVVYSMQECELYEHALRDVLRYSAQYQREEKQ